MWYNNPYYSQGDLEHSSIEWIMSQNNPKSVQKLEKMIAVNRRKMQKLWEVRGYTDTEVLEASIELDTLLNLYQKQKLQSDSKVQMK